MKDSSLYSYFTKDELETLMHRAQDIGYNTDEFEEMLYEASMNDDYKDHLFLLA